MTRFGHRLTRRVFAVHFAGLALFVSSGLAADFTITLTGDIPGLPTVIAPGGTAAFRAAAASAAAGQYQWYFNELPLGGATGTALSLANLTSAQTGNYRLNFVPVSGAVQWSNTLTLNVITPPPSPVDPSFTAASSAGTSRTDPVAVANDGHILIKTFTTDANFAVTQHYARLQADGSADPTFSFPDAAGVILAVLPDGGIITSKPPYRLNPDGSASTFNLPAAFDSTQPLTMADVQSDGRFLLGQPTTLMRFNADGTPDPAFVYPYTHYGSVLLDWIKVDLQGRIVLHSRGEIPADPLMGIPASYFYQIFRLTPTGTLDLGFQSTSIPVASYPGDYTTFYPLAGGGYLVLWAADGLYDLIRLNDDGTRDTNWSSDISFRDSMLVVDTAGRLFRTYPAFGASPLSYALSAYHVTATTLTLDSAFYPGLAARAVAPPPGNFAYILGSMVLQPDGELLVGGDFASWDGHATLQLARLRTVDAAYTPVRIIAAPPTAPRGGDPYTLSTSGGGGGPFTYQWLALDGQTLPAGTTSDSLVFPAFAKNQFGRYQLRLTGATGSTLSPVIELGYDGTDLPYLANLSGRSRPGTGENATMAGLTLKSVLSTDSMPILVRGVGPTLGSLGLASFLPNPAFNVYDLHGVAIANNDNWGGDSTITYEDGNVGAFPLLPNSLDAALLLYLPTSNNVGQFTTQLFDQGGGSGVGLIEFYRADGQQPWERQLHAILNLSLRAPTGPGDSTAIAGFVIIDPQNFGRSARVLLRAIGPTLSQYGIAHPLADPLLTVYNSQGQAVAQNDNWSEGGDVAGLAGVMNQVGAFALPTGSKDAALAIDLPAGAYTMQASGGTGVVILEIYLVP